MKKNKLTIFILGAMCFIVSQVFLRIPLVNMLMGTSKFNLLEVLYPFLILIGISFSAGIFEESFRFIFKKYLLRPDKSGISEPIIFGLGHGIAEALIILGPFIGKLSIENLTFGIIERILAITLHVGLSVIVWNGFQLDKRFRYLMLAILIHGLVNTIVQTVLVFTSSIIMVELVLAIIVVAIIAYVYKSRYLYNMEEGII